MGASGCGHVSRLRADDHGKANLRVATLAIALCRSCSVGGLIVFAVVTGKGDEDVSGLGSVLERTIQRRFSHDRGATKRRAAILERGRDKMRGERGAERDVGVALMVEVMVIVVVFWSLPASPLALMQPSLLTISPVGSILAIVRVEGDEVILTLARRIRDDSPLQSSAELGARVEKWVGSSPEPGVLDSFRPLGSVTVAVGTLNLLISDMAITANENATVAIAIAVVMRIYPQSAIPCLR
jgi:hypothetical protein